MAVRGAHGTTHPFHARADVANQPQLSLSFFFPKEAMPSLRILSNIMLLFVIS